MSIYDNAGVALIPSGTKASKLYSVLPANGDGDFTHSRGSTATRVNKDGFIESVATNVPRLDYPLIDGVVQDCPALLLEPQRTNNLQRTEEFDNGYWVNNGVTITSNQIISPSGTLNADLLSGVSGGFGVVVFSTWSATNKVASCFAKKGSTNLFKIANVSASNRYVLFDLSNGTVSEESSGWTGFIENYGNGWYRCTAISNNETGTFSLGVTAVSESIYLWGAQLESGSYATSYIPWDGSGTTTRSADVCNGSGTSAEFNDSEGVLFAELEWLETSTNIYLSLSDGTNNNRILIYSSGVSEIRGLVQDSGSTQASFIVDANAREFSRVAVLYKQNYFAIWINGIELATDSSGTTPSGLDTLAFNAGATASFYGKTKQVMTFKTALNDSELETLTSWDSFNAMATGQLYTIE